MRAGISVQVNNCNMSHVRDWKTCIKISTGRTLSGQALQAGAVGREQEAESGAAGRVSPDLGAVGVNSLPPPQSPEGYIQSQALKQTLSPLPSGLGRLLNKGNEIFKKVSS